MGGAAGRPVEQEPREGKGDRSGEGGVVGNECLWDVEGKTIGFVGGESCMGWRRGEERPQGYIPTSPIHLPMRSFSHPFIFPSSNAFFLFLISHASRFLHPIPFPVDFFGPFFPTQNLFSPVFFFFRHRLFFFCFELRRISFISPHFFFGHPFFFCHPVSRLCTYPSIPSIHPYEPIHPSTHLFVRGALWYDMIWYGMV